MKKDAYYFSHDANARNDLKCLHLRKVLGWEGYGIFWALIEKLRDEPEHKIPLSNVPLIAFEFNTSEEKINSVITLFDLFVIENDVFFSSRLLSSMDAYKSIKSRLSEAGKKGVEARLKGGLSKASTGFKQLKERKGKEMKGNKIKRNLIKDFIQPTIEDFKLYARERGYSEKIAETAWHHYSNLNWHDKDGNRIVVWKNKLNNVWFKGENGKQEFKKSEIKDNNW